MNRRKAIKRTSIIMGAAISSGTLAGLMAGCKAEKHLNWQPQWLNDEEARTLSALTDTILPKTKTPSAAEVGVPEYIDDIVGNFWSKENQNGFRSGITKVNTWANDQFGKSYENLNENQQNQGMDAVVDEARNPGGGTPPFFLQLKELTYSGYFSSQVIGEQVLGYDPVPGEYIGDLPVSEVDKAWSL